MTFVIGNTNRISASIFAPGNTIASLVSAGISGSRWRQPAIIRVAGAGVSAVRAVPSWCWRRRACCSSRGCGCERRDGHTRAGARCGRGGRPWAPAPRRSDTVARGLAMGATVLALAVLAWILFTLLRLGLPGIRLGVFTTVTMSPGSNGGLANAIVGSIVQTALGTAVGTPIGLLVGTYLAEYSRGSLLGNVVRFVSDILLSAPSILIGLFIFSVLVAPFGGFSGLAGAAALAVIVIPIVVRTTEDMLNLVPVSLREASIALGAPRWKTIVLVCYRAVLTGLMTGILLATARGGRRDSAVAVYLTRQLRLRGSGLRHGKPARYHLSIRGICLR